MWNIYHKGKPEPEHLRIGRLGEGLAANILRQLGHRIIEKNYRKPYGEIDLVTKRDKVLHLVEVKTLSTDVTRRTLPAFSPADHYNHEKKQRQKRVIETYLTDRRVRGEVDWQVDLVEIVLDKEDKLIRYEVLEDVIL